MTAAAFYEGSVRHRRHAVRERAFRHRISMVYADLTRPPALIARRLRASRLLAPDAVRALVAGDTGEAPDGAIGVLTQLRTFGVAFTPVSFYYCERGDGTLHSVVAEVTNTPWGERKAYVLTAAGAKVERGAFDKRLHVSPFMPMDQRYSWSTTRPGADDPTLSVHIASATPDGAAFDATLKLRRRPLSRRARARHSRSALRVLPLIYAHALVLAVKRVPVHPHPTQEARS